ncbi:DUF3800 domain-containing protein [Aeribacillus sp. FSL K6-1121]|uniref:DUF3800 domain-containing protein n=1 Tax=Aeribacillus sp. FSL K6-1121 TaxID=2954745 RepID=UPI0030F669A2
MNEEFLVFLDETGDHSLRHVDKEYPIFALGAMYCKRDDYINTINPLFDEFKYEFFNKRNIILHSTDIRKSRKNFNILMNKQVREKFFERLNNAISSSPYYFAFSLVDKMKHTDTYIDPDNPYDLTLAFIMERSFFLIHKKYPDAKCRFIAESRDTKENKNLKSVFERIKSNGTQFVSGSELEFITDLDFISKQENENGHQIVDLCLYPLARTYLTNKCHPSVPVYYNKIYKNPRNGSPIGYGIKTFPNNISSELVREIEMSCI